MRNVALVGLTDAGSNFVSQFAVCRTGAMAAYAMQFELWKTRIPDGYCMADRQSGLFNMCTSLMN
jgi:hypothetical protein